jgi:hypothetical protein
MTNDDADAELKRAQDSFERYLKEHPEKPDPHGLLFYLYRAEALLNDDAVRLPASISLSQEERAVLVRHLARARARLSPEARTLLIRYVTKAVGIVEKPEPLPLSDKKAVYMFVGTMYRLVPHLELLKTTLWDEMPYESAAAARAAKASKSPSPEEQELRRRIGELDTGNLPAWSEANTMLDTLQREGFEGRQFRRPALRPI